MKKITTTTLSILALVLVAGLSGCSSSTSIQTQAKKSALCGATIAVDRESTNVNSQEEFLAVLKTHQAQVETMRNNLPPGSIGTEIGRIVNAMELAIARSSTAPFNSIENGQDLDTYCGVDGNGDPLPSDYAAGKGTEFCNGFVFVYQGVTAATTPAGSLSALVSSKGQVDQLATELSSLPSSIQAQASAAVSAAQSAIAQNNAASLMDLAGPATNVALYCGRNT
jgi:hypothetical protein